MFSNVPAIAAGIGLVLLLPALAAAAWRIHRGPDAVDRATALEFLTGLILSAIALLAVAGGQPVLLDLWPAVAALGAIGTVALARALSVRGIDREPPPPRPPAPPPSRQPARPRPPRSR